MYPSPFEQDLDTIVPVVTPDPFEDFQDRPYVPSYKSKRNNSLYGANKNDVIPLRYHYGDDHDHVLLGKDLYEERHTLSCNVSIACLIGSAIELSVFSWPIISFSIWGLEFDTILTLIFTINLFKAMILFIKSLTNTMVFRMQGRNSYHWFWGIWTRSSHVHQDPLLYMYSLIYGWIQIPIMCLFVIISASSYPLYSHIIPYFINISVAFLSLLLGYIVWCILISERSIRMQLQKRVDFTPQQRQKTMNEEYRKSAYIDINQV